MRRWCRFGSDFCATMANRADEADLFRPRQQADEGRRFPAATGIKIHRGAQDDEYTHEIVGGLGVKFFPAPIPASGT